MQSRVSVAVKTLSVVMLLAGWILLAPNQRWSFDSAVACSAEVTAWQARAQEGARWVVRQYQQALQQKDQAVTTFWRKAASRAAEQVTQASAARCVEVKL